MVWTVTRLAEATGYTSRHIRHLIYNGVIKAQKITSGWIVEDEEAQRFIQERKGRKKLEEESAA